MANVQAVTMQKVGNKVCNKVCSKVDNKVGKKVGNKVGNKVVNKIEVFIECGRRRVPVNADGGEVEDGGRTSHHIERHPGVTQLISCTDESQLKSAGSEQPSLGRDEKANSRIYMLSNEASLKQSHGRYQILGPSYGRYQVLGPSHESDQILGPSHGRYQVLRPSHGRYQDLGSSYGSK
ncbi:hypothetical protein MAR_020202 [Mya arenaria]|uniref:Uncharacterized protein n=1 Tax=Mya arenaria TaxID=6604 RepID=A0ABY7E4A3_MYAAR|nr:hypothetical protein MAR_020202 [Mya arenaria]